MLEVSRGRNGFAGVAANLGRPLFISALEKGGKVCGGNRLANLKENLGEVFLITAHPSLFFSFLIYFIEVSLIYNVVLISAVQQSDSVIHIYTSFPSLFLCDVFTGP